jgi:hypothetical protein
MADTIDLGNFADLDMIPPLAVEEPADEVDVEPAAEWFDDWEDHLAGLRRARPRG